MINTILLAAKFVSSACFLSYGFRLLLSQHMKAEFERYGLSRFRRLIGWLQLSGSIGIAAGAYLPILATLAALGLAVLMALGIAARAKAGDSLVEMFPAIFLLILNAFIVFACLR